MNAGVQARQYSGLERMSAKRLPCAIRALHFITGSAIVSCIVKDAKWTAIWNKAGDSVIAVLAGIVDITCLKQVYESIKDRCRLRTGGLPKCNVSGFLAEIK